MKIIKFHKRIQKIMKIIEFYMRIPKKGKSRIPLENYENHEHYTTLCENKDNHEAHIISCESN